MWYKMAEVDRLGILMLRTKDPYEFFGIPSNASPEEIKKAYRKVITKYHSDLHPGDKNAHEIMVKANDLYPKLVERSKNGGGNASNYTKTTYTPPKDTKYDDFIDLMRRQREEQKNRHLTVDEISYLAMELFSGFNHADMTRILAHLKMCGRCLDLYKQAVEIRKKQKEDAKPFNVFKKKVKDFFTF